MVSSGNSLSKDTAARRVVEYILVWTYKLSAIIKTVVHIFPLGTMKFETALKIACLTPLLAELVFQAILFQINYY